MDKACGICDNWRIAFLSKENSLVDICSIFIDVIALRNSMALTFKKILRFFQDRRKIRIFEKRKKYLAFNKSNKLSFLRIRTFQFL